MTEPRACEHWRVKKNDGPAGHFPLLSLQFCGLCGRAGRTEEEGSGAAPCGEAFSSRLSSATSNPLPIEGLVCWLRFPPVCLPSACSYIMKHNLCCSASIRRTTIHSTSPQCCSHSVVGLPLFCPLLKHLLSNRINDSISKYFTKKSTNLKFYPDSNHSMPIIHKKTKLFGDNIT